MKLSITAGLLAAILSLSGCELLGALGGAGEGSGAPATTGSVRASVTFGSHSAGDYLLVKVYVYTPVATENVAKTARAAATVATGTINDLSTSPVAKVLNGISPGDYTVHVDHCDSLGNIISSDGVVVTVTAGDTVTADLDVIPDA